MGAQWADNLVHFVVSVVLTDGCDGFLVLYATYTYGSGPMMWAVVGVKRWCAATQALFSEVVVAPVAVSRHQPSAESLAEDVVLASEKQSGSV